MGYQIKILVANYGGKDVTEIAKKQHKASRNFTASNDHFGDPLPGVPKFLHVIYSYHGVLGSVAIPEGHKFEPTPPAFHIIGALYGGADVSAKVAKLGHEFKVENAHFGDPNPNVFKTFTIAYVKNGELKTITAKEHEQIHLH